MKKSKLRLITAVSASVLLSTAVSCNQSGTTKSEESADTSAVEEVEVTEIEEEETHTGWVVREHAINEIAVTSKGKSGESKEMRETVKKEDSKTDLDRKAEVDDKYEVTSHEVLKTALSDEGYMHLSEITITETVIPVGSTETIVSYSGKGKVKDTLQVVADANGEVQHIVFTHKHHKDEYDVAVGMTAKDVKHLRKDMKHMEKHGKVFMYSESSNIMYVLTATNEVSDEYEESNGGKQEAVASAEVDEMKVQAIVWKDKKYHENN